MNNTLDNGREAKEEVSSTVTILPPAIITSSTTLASACRLHRLLVGQLGTLVGSTRQ